MSGDIYYFNERTQVSSWVPPRDWIEPSPAQAVVPSPVQAATSSSTPVASSVKAASDSQAARVLQDAQKAMNDFELSDSDDASELDTAPLGGTDSNQAAEATAGSDKTVGLSSELEPELQSGKMYTRRESNVILQEAQNAMKDFELSDSDDDNSDMDIDNDPIFSTV